LAAPVSSYRNDPPEKYLASLKTAIAQPCTPADASIMKQVECQAHRPNMHIRRARQPASAFFKAISRSGLVRFDRSTRLPAWLNNHGM